MRPAAILPSLLAARPRLASYGVVLGVSAVALGADPSGRLAGVAADVVFMAGALACMTTVLFIVEVVRGLTRTGVARRLVICLARGYLMAVTGGPRESEDEERSHLDTSLLEALTPFHLPDRLYFHARKFRAGTLTAEPRRGGRPKGRPDRLVDVGLRHARRPAASTADTISPRRRVEGPAESP